MAYLHENREEFENAVNLASKHFHILPVIVEKDYYVTMILRIKALLCLKVEHHFPNAIK